MSWSKNRFIVCILLLTAIPVFAQSQDPLCRLNKYQPRYISWLPEVPSYFAKVHPAGKFAFFIGLGNKIVNLEEPDLKKRILSIPGSIDPVPCPDGKLLTIPGLSLYEVSTVLKEGIQAQPILNDYSHEGVYQSCAVLSKYGETTVYRVITDASGEVSYRDYKVRYSNSHPARVTALSEMKPRCPRMNLKTIIISKTGKYLSGYVPDSGTTKIFNIEGRSSECREVADIGYATGKLEFNYDDSRVAFHVDYFSSQAGDYFSGVSNDLTKDVFTLDIQKSGNKLLLKNLRRLSTAQAKGSGSYYPSFAKSGEVLFLNDDDNFYSFHAIDPEKVPAFSPVLPPPDGWPEGHAPSNIPSDWKQRLHAASALGSLWSKRCSQDDEEVSAAEAASVRMALPTSTCLALVNEYWKPGFGEELAHHVRFSRDGRFDPKIISQFDVETLKQSCKDSPDVQNHPPLEYGSKLNNGTIDGPHLIQYYCVGCHVTGGSLRLPDGSTIPNTLNFADLKAWQIEAALWRIEQPAGEGRMPPRGFEPAVEGLDHKQVLKDYLNCRLRQLNTPKGRPAPWCDH